jgi:hypothetical protein
MELNKEYNPVSCEHKLPNGFTAWHFQSEEQSNLDGANKVSIHVCLLCGEISIGGYRPGKDEKHSNSFHEKFNISHPLAIDAIIKQANFYNEEAKWCRANDYNTLQAKCDTLEKSCNEKNAIITSLNDLTNNLQAKCEKYEVALKDIAKQSKIDEMDANEVDGDISEGYDAIIKVAREALSAGEGDKEVERQWWEGMAIHDLPEYVKVIKEECAKDTGLYCKVFKWSIIDTTKGQYFGAELDGYEPSYLCQRELNFPGQVYGRLNIIHLQPATEADYNSYKNQK